ncbi:DUF2058 domain-containing protein [Ferrimonas sediminicola]|uniref:DUF2058 domain-containing protein n=1 Tax=Ferrimonas sediminicola TaxID=2569538 RepID=A0A4U1BD60_9GAMM|nr:DUF2058 domain-containing protein [Ferrimonas sediminicola]TKB48185.1 DUF2058 domain-containing protein [Ferrimonas sediminicola]
MSLADQLLKAGLADKKSVQKAKKEKHKQRKTKQAVTDESKQLAEQRKREQQQRDRELNRQRQEEAEAKAILAQIKQLIDTSKQDRSRGDIAYNFSHDGKITKVYVTKAQQQQLIAGQLGIVIQEESYELVPSKVVEKIEQRDPAMVIPLAKKEENTPEEDDPYADYQIPDDLMW